MRKYLRKYRKEIFLEVFFSSIYSVCIGAIPIIIKFLIDNALDLNAQRLVWLIVIYIGVVLVGMLTQYYNQYYCWIWTSLMQKELRLDLLDSILNGNFQDYKTYKKDEYLSIFSNDVTAITQQYFEKLVDIIKSSITVLIYGVYMFYFLGVTISLVIISTSLLALFLPQLTSEKLSDRKVGHLNALGHLTNVISDILSGFALTNSKTKAHVLAYYNQTAADVQQKEVKYGHFKAFTIVFEGLAMYALDILAFMIAGIMLVLKKISVGTASATLSYVDTFIWPIRYIIADLNEMSAVKKVIGKVSKILDRVCETKETIHDVKHLHIEDLSVVLGEFILASFNLEATKGHKYAIIGHSGSGKSTIFNCLTQQIIPTSGEMKLDGKSLSCLDLANLLSGVYQGNHIYQASVVDNISQFGSYQLDILNDYLTIYPNKKIDALLQVKDASSLSNGEKQIVALLRTWVANTPIILLDEAFSAIDIMNRGYFLDMFLNTQDKIILMITHNLDESLLNRFDQVIHLDRNKERKGN